MSDGSEGDSLLYLLDANVLIDANRDYYPITRVPEFWEWLLHQAALERIAVPLEIHEELTDGSDVLSEWMRDHREVLVLQESVREELVAEVTSVGYADDLDDEEIEKLGRDPFLIAYALADRARRCVVTTEASRPKRDRANRHIPDVCRSLGVRCRNTFQLLRELNFSTQWKA